MKHTTGSVLKANARVQHPGLSIHFARESAGRFGKMAEKFSRPQTLSSDNIADIVRRVVGAFGNLPSNPSNESGSASSSGFLMLTPNTNFMIGFAFHVLQQHHHLGLEEFFPELDRVVGSFLTQGERQIANSFHSSIIFTAEISETEITLNVKKILAVSNATYAVAKRKPEKIRLAGITFLVTKVYKGERFHKESVLDVKTQLTLQTNGDFSIHEFLFASPTRRYKRIYQRGVLKAP